jgi:hypothetical protein
LTIAGTIEDRILELQEKKRELAAAALGGDKNIGKLNMKDLLDLFRHDNHEPAKWNTGTSWDDGKGEDNLPTRERVVEDMSHYLTASSRPRGTKGMTPAKKVVEHPVYGRR